MKLINYYLNLWKEFAELHLDDPEKSDGILKAADQLIGAMTNLLGATQVEEGMFKSRLWLNMYTLVCLKISHQYDSFLTHNYPWLFIILEINIENQFPCDDFLFAL